MMHKYLPSDFTVGLRIALRARFISISIWLLLALAIVTLLAAQFSGRQPATVALDVGISAIRLSLPLVVVLIVQELFAREFDRRYFLTSLSYPRARHWFFLGRLSAAFTLSSVLLIAMAISLAVIVSVVGRGYDQATPVALDHHYLITLAFIVLDLITTLAMGSLLAITASTPSFILIGTFGFVIAARSFSTIILLITQQQELVSNPELYRQSLGILTYILPDLGALDVRATTLYGSMTFVPPDWPIRIISIIAYAVVLIGISLWALHRKRFA